MNNVSSSSEGTKIYKDVIINQGTNDEILEPRLILHLSPEGRIIVYDEGNGNEVFKFNRQSNRKAELVVYNPATGNEIFSQRSDEEDDKVHCVIQRPSGNEVFVIKSSQVTGNDTEVYVNNQNNVMIAKLNGDGSGFLANGNIAWDADGNLNAKTIS